MVCNSQRNESNLYPPKISNLNPQPRTLDPYTLLLTVFLAYAVGGLASRLGRVLNSQYMTAQPQVKQAEELEAKLEDHTTQQQQQQHQQQQHQQQQQQYHGYQEVDYSGQGGALAVSQAEAVLAPSSTQGREPVPGTHLLSTIELQMGVHPQSQVLPCTHQ